MKEKLVKYYNGRQIKRTKSIISPIDGSIKIRITFKGNYGQRGDQIVVTESEYREGRTVTVEKVAESAPLTATTQ